MKITSKVVACMATFSARYPMVPMVAESIAPQVDWLIIYANGSLSEFPDLSYLRNVIVMDSDACAGDLSANGKVYPFQFLEDCLIFTIDDDLIFPPDYVERYRKIFDAFDNKCCVTTHGSIFSPGGRWYYDRSGSFPLKRGLGNVQLVTLAGSGTFAFHQSTLPCSTEEFFPETMVDLNISVLARQQRLPIWCIDRPDNWLRFLELEGLWEQFRARLTHHTYEARRQDWTFSTYREIARDALAIVERKRAAGLTIEFALDSELAAALESGEPPTPWRLGRVSFQQRRKYLELLESM